MNPFKLIKAMFTSVSQVQPSDAFARIRAGEALLVDVREPSEWAGGVALHAKLLSFSDLNGPRTQWSAFLAGAAGREILVYCASGGRSGMVARLLTGEGFRVSNTGGLSDWAAAKWPIVKPAKVRS